MKTEQRLIGSSLTGYDKMHNLIKVSSSKIDLVGERERHIVG